MKVIDIYKKATGPVFSIEVSPPVNGTSLDPIFNTVSALLKYDPAFVSVTCSALGSARGGTIPIAGRLKRELGIESVVHFTCVNKSKQDIENLLMDVKYDGVQNILALRGDPPKGEKEFRPHEKGHRYASDFVKQIKLMNEGKFLTAKEGEYREGEPTDFCVSVAGYPEGHPECPDKEKDLGHLKIKVDNGADYVITQLFFNPEYFFDFVERARSIGINVPIIPGVMPIESFAQLEFILRQPIGVKAPAYYVEKFRKYKEEGDDLSAQKFGVEYTVSMIDALLSNGTPGIHIYTMNTPDRAGRIFEHLKVKAA
ncbi:MAG: methylenetetrahydrofolate reductase [Bacillota bacterium]